MTALESPSALFVGGGGAALGWEVSQATGGPPRPRRCGWAGSHLSAEAVDELGICDPFVEPSIYLIFPVGFKVRNC